MEHKSIEGLQLKELPLISVIIPVYKVEPYLDRCIKSVVKQTYKNIEIILVDDGSPDNCGAICEKWKGQDNRISVIHKKNGGLSDARNAGLERASGKYIGFVDSDDYVEPEMYELLIKAMYVTRADVVNCAAVDEFEGQKVLTKKSSEVIEMSSKEAILDLFERGKYTRHAVWNKLYRKELFYEIQFPVGRLFEDAAIMFRIFERSQVIASINAECYHYVKRYGSISNNIYNRNSVLHRYENGVNIFKHFEKDHQIQEAVFKWNIVCFFRLWKEAYDNSDLKTSSQIYYGIKKMMSNHCTKKIDLRLFIKTVLFRYLYPLYIVIYRVRRK